jgi:hypothetical protein
MPHYTELIDIMATLFIKFSQIFIILNFEMVRNVV